MHGSSPGRNRLLSRQRRQLHDEGPSAARTAPPMKQKDEMYISSGHPDNIQDPFRGPGSDTAILLDGGGRRSAP